MHRENIQIPKDALASFCRKNAIQKLSLFGSVLREDFNAESDIDVLVEFTKEAQVGMIKMAQMEEELTELLGRKVDLNTPNFLHRSFRHSVIENAQVQYEAAA